MGLTLSHGLVVSCMPVETRPVDSEHDEEKNIHNYEKVEVKIEPASDSDHPTNDMTQEPTSSPQRSTFQTSAGEGGTTPLPATVSPDIAQGSLPSVADTGGGEPTERKLGQYDGSDDVVGSAAKRRRVEAAHTQRRDASSCDSEIVAGTEETVAERIALEGRPPLASVDTASFECTPRSNRSVNSAVRSPLREQPVDLARLPPDNDSDGSESEIDQDEQMLLALVGKIRNKCDEYRLFAQPVDPVKDECPNYYEVIDRHEEAMDLETIEKLIRQRSIDTLDELEIHLRRIVHCAMKYYTDVDDFTCRQAEKFGENALVMLDRARHAKELNEIAASRKAMAASRTAMAVEIQPFQWCLFKSNEEDRKDIWLGRALPRGDGQWKNNCTVLNSSKRYKTIWGLKLAPGAVAINIQWYAEVKGGNKKKAHVYRVSRGMWSNPVVWRDKELLMVGSDLVSHIRGPKERNFGATFDFEEWYGHELERSYAMDQGIRDEALAVLGSFW